MQKSVGMKVLAVNRERFRVKLFGDTVLFRRVFLAGALETNNARGSEDVKLQPRTWDRSERSPSTLTRRINVIVFLTIP